MRLLSSLSPLAIVRQLRQGKDASTFERLGQSRHVADLRLIFSVTVIIMIVGTILALLFCFEHQLVNKWKAVEAHQSGWVWVQLALSAISDSGVIVSAIGVMGCGVLTWTYQTGSARLGVVDLFACEIATLCRVAAVTEMVQRYVDLFSADPPSVRSQVTNGESPINTSRFSSRECYFPVFESTIKDLQQLEEGVVKNVTAFYTYMKVMRDSLRKLSEMSSPSAAHAPTDARRRAICGVVYMQFLALESARKAITDLVEFEPVQAEDTITILLSELVAFRFLKVQFTDDLRRPLLLSREATYRQQIPVLQATVAAGIGPQWNRAKDIMVELMKRYCLACPPPASA